MNQMQHDFAGSPVAHQDYGPLLGTPFKVYLSNGVDEQVDPESGGLVTEITDLPGLIAAIVQTRVLHPRKLSGDDLRYIRSALCFKSNRVASALDLTPEHYSRCETGTKTMSSEKEKFYRMSVFLAAFLKDKGVLEKFSQEKLLDDSLKPASPEKAQKALDAFKKIFFDMKLESVYPAGERLELAFSRCEECPQSGDDDGKWLSYSDAA